MGVLNERQIDSVHCRAICDEIGERLRMMLRPETAALPVRLQILLDRLADQERDLAPSIFAYELTSTFVARDAVKAPALTDAKQRYFDNFNLTFREMSLGE